MKKNKCCEKAAFHNLLSQVTNSTDCIELALQINGAQKEKALKKALELTQNYEDALIVYSSSAVKTLQNEAIAKAIALTDVIRHLNFWATQAPNNKLRLSAINKLNQLRKEG